jgi:hypothetical protein
VVGSLSVELGWVGVLSVVISGFDGQGVVTTEFMTAVARVPWLCEVSASPSSRVPVRLASVCDDPGTGVQVRPSGDVAALKVVPARVSCRYVGAVPPVRTWLVVPPCAVRHCTATPLLGVMNTA